MAALAVLLLITLMSLPVSLRGCIEQAPEVKNFRCEVYNWEHSMTCSWNLGVNLTKDVLSREKFKFRTKQMMARDWQDCPNLNPEGKCVLPLILLGLEMDMQMDISNNDCPNVVRKEWKINSLDYVKPAPVDNLIAESISSTCVKLRWSHGKKFNEKKYRLSYLAVNGRDKNEKETGVDVTSYTACHLHPYTNYTFSLAVHPNRNRGYWSASVTATARTLATVPAAAPVLTTSSYQWYNQDCQDESTAVIYWQPLKEYDRNGPVPRIHIRTDPVSNSQTQLYTVPDDVPQVTMFLRCDTAYKVTLQAVNDEGAAPQMSTLTVPAAQSDIPTTGFVKIETDNTDFESQAVYIEWERVTAMPAARLQYRVYWCRDGSKGCQRREQIQWRRFDGDINNTTLNISRPLENMYGIAVEGDSLGSKGFSTRHSCVYTRGTRPGVPERFKVQRGEEDNSLYVNWQRLLCQRGVPYVTGYRIYYWCKSDAYPAKQYKEVGPTKSSVLLRDLLPDKEYEIQIQALSDGEAGPLSSPVTATPKNDDLSGGAVATIVVVGAIALIIAVFGCKSCYRKTTGLFKLRVDICIPEIQVGQDNRSFQTSNNNVNIMREPSRSSIAGTYIPKGPVNQMSVDSGVPEDLPYPGVANESTWSKDRLLQEAANIEQGLDGPAIVTDGTGLDPFPPTQLVSTAAVLVHHDANSVLSDEDLDSSGRSSLNNAAGDSASPLLNPCFGDKGKEAITAKPEISDTGIKHEETTPPGLQSNTSMQITVDSKAISRVGESKHPMVISDRSAEIDNCSQGIAKQSVVSADRENFPYSVSNPEFCAVNGYVSSNMAIERRMPLVISN